MAKLIAVPEQGLEGLQSLIDSARPGDSIECLPGVYSGDRNLIIGVDRLELYGSQDPEQTSLLQLHISLEQPAGIGLNNRSEVQIHHLQLELFALEPCADDQSFGGIHLLNSTNCTLNELALYCRNFGSKPLINGIYVELCKAIEIRHNSLHDLWNGVYGNGCQELNCEANICEGNWRAGICYFGCHGLVTGNRLLANGSHGIYIGFDTQSKIGSKVDAKNNIAENNKESGISYYGSQGRVSGSHLRGNETCGLFVVNDLSGHQISSEVIAENNLAENNKMAGISYFGSRGRVIGNRLLSNHQHGLSVSYDFEREIGCEVGAEDNVAEFNNMSGIAYSGSRGLVCGNRLQGNDHYGLVVSYFLEGRTCSEVDAENNIAENNKLAGIAYFGSRGLICGNLLIGNREWGLLIKIESDSKLAGGSDTTDLALLIEDCVFADNSSAFALYVLDRTARIVGCVAAQHLILLASDSQFAKLTANDCLIWPAANLGHLGALELYQANNGTDPLNTHFRQLTLEYGEDVAHTVLSWGSGSDLRTALHLPLLAEPEAEHPVDCQCYEYQPMPAFAPSMPKTEADALWQDVVLQPSRYVNWSPSRCIDSWLRGEATMPSLWGFVGYIDLQALKQSFAAQIERRREDESPLQRILQRHRLHWLTLQGADLDATKEVYAGNAVIRQMIKQPKQKDDEQTEVFVVSDQCRMGLTVTRTWVLMRFLMVVALPYALTGIAFLGSWLWAAVANQWLGTDVLISLIVRLADEFVSGYDLVNQGWQHLTAFGLSAAAIIGVFSFPLRILANVVILPPHCAFNSKWATGLERWLIAKRWINRHWWQDWRGREWLALTIFGRSLWRPWLRHNWVVLSWEQIETIGEEERQFLEYLFLQAKRHRCRLLVMLNLSDRGLLETCAKPIANAEGQTQRWFVVDIDEPVDSSPPVEMAEVWKEIAARGYGHALVDVASFMGMVLESKFDWTDAPLMASVASSPRLPIRFAVVTSKDSRQAAISYREANAHTPLSLFRPTFREFWAWLYQATDNPDRVLPWGDDYMADAESSFWPFFTDASIKNTVRWHWINQEMQHQEPQLLDWRVLAVKSGYQREVVAMLNQIFANSQGCDSYLTYAALWGEGYYLHLSSIYLQAAESASQEKHQPELYSLAALALECALSKFELLIHQNPPQVANLLSVRGDCFTAWLNSTHPEPERIAGLLLHYWHLQPTACGTAADNLELIEQAISNVFAWVGCPLQFGSSLPRHIDTLPIIAAAALSNIDRFLLIVRLSPITHSRTLFEFGRKRYWIWLDRGYVARLDGNNPIALAAQAWKDLDNANPKYDPLSRQMRELWPTITTVENIEQMSRWARVAPEFAAAGLIGAAKWTLLQRGREERECLDLWLGALLCRWRQAWNTDDRPATVSVPMTMSNSAWPTWLKLLFEHQDTFFQALGDCPITVPQPEPVLPLLEGIGYSLIQTNNERRLLHQVIARIS